MADRESILDGLASMFVPIHRDGQLFVGIAFLATVALFLVWSPLGWLGAMATAWVAYLFRDPDRVVPMRDGLYLAPADGRIEDIGEVVPDAALDLGDGPRLRISIHLSLMDVHLTRAPIAGEVVRTIYAPGSFGNVRAEKASRHNEQRATVLEAADTGRVAVVQIAGGIRRRIVTFVGDGDRVGAGERIGLIRFGSRVDVYLPAALTPLVGVGQTLVGGETVLADKKNPNDERSTRVV